MTLVNDPLYWRDAVSWLVKKEPRYSGNGEENILIFSYAKYRTVCTTTKRSNKFFRNKSPGVPFEILSKNYQQMFMLSSTQQDRPLENSMAQQMYINYHKNIIYSESFTIYCRN